LSEEEKKGEFHVKISGKIPNTDVTLEVEASGQEAKDLVEHFLRELEIQKRRIEGESQAE